MDFQAIILMEHAFNKKVIYFLMDVPVIPCFIPAAGSRSKPAAARFRPCAKSDRAIGRRAPKPNPGKPVVAKRKSRYIGELNIDIAAKRRKKHKNQILGVVISICYHGQK